ncbi:MAG: hypothetical protein NTV52_06950 [Acidobacteria bacterium]|nr:hypothetical protein [Acidobacteriota bacterium]
MRQWAWGLMLAAVALGSFFYWGAFTLAGNRRFDEMDGIIPYAAGLLAVILALVAAVLFLIAWKRG